MFFCPRNSRPLVITSVIVATLTLSGCAGGFLGSSNCGTTSSSPGLFESGGLFSDGPVRRFLRGDSCDECNAPAGQLQAPPCDPCFDTGTIVPNGNWALPSAPGAVQPVTSFYSDSGLSSAPFEQEVLPGELTLPPASLPQSLPGLSPAGSGSTFSRAFEPSWFRTNSFPNRRQSKICRLFLYLHRTPQKRAAIPAGRRFIIGCCYTEPKTYRHQSTKKGDFWHVLQAYSVK